MTKPATKFAAIAFIAMALPGVGQAQCPPNATLMGTKQQGDLKILDCKCNDGFEKHGNACVRITTMRAQTKPECVRSAGTQLQEELDRCKAPLRLCLNDPAVNEKVGTCLAVAALIKFDPSKVTVLGALIACGLATPDAYKIVHQCPEIKDECLVSALKTHKDNVKDCDSN